MAEQGRDSENDDRLLTVEEAALKLHVSKDFLYRRADQFPFSVHIGRRLLFSEQRHRAVDTKPTQNMNWGSYWTQIYIVFPIGSSSVVMYIERIGGVRAHSQMPEQNKDSKDAEKNGYCQQDIIWFGFSARHWQQIEKGRPITLRTLLRICVVFRIPMARLVRGLDAHMHGRWDARLLPRLGYR
jgi:predicted DNA-binding transcriptional regulator AlpA